MLGNRKITIASLLLFCGIISFTLPHAAAQTAGPTTAPSTQPEFPAVETVVLFRHGEKPATGLGQLTPQGLNRALALSVLLPQKFGNPDYLFAPDPAQQNSDQGHPYYYIRPLATIEMTAIRLGMPVQTPCGYKEIDKLNDELTKPEYAHAMIFVSWEHTYGQKAAAALFAKFGGDASKVPMWPSADFDSLYVITIHRTAENAATATFDHQQEDLNGQSKEMPVPAGK
jgi:hypothetical protein